ncbi:interleukin-7 receptor subunit alpha isoform X2 [Clupea harengus]|uniref:Interleukin-7 receptor subunit alpha isoform X2 n=1 Tax=Clupea harengus TaxID=7950 RepID=A0A8M1KN66_CLUHA|nr:interleukin-7 receptor subunit alpha isoform X2 [Clupea harengus]
MLTIEHRFSSRILPLSLGEERNITWNGSRFTEKVYNILLIYQLIIHGNERPPMKMPQIVKLPAPQTVAATYLKSPGAVNISVGYRHDYVKSFNFEVRILDTTTSQDWTYESQYEPFMMEPDVTPGSEYSVKVRVKPEPGYFNGRWSDWSHTINFMVDKDEAQSENKVLLYIIIIAIITIVLLVVCLATRFRRKELKAYILPNVPHPKTTLVNMQKFNKSLLLSFSPETFNDIHIKGLDEDGEDKPLSPDGQERAGTRSHSPSQLSQVLLWQLPAGDGRPGGSQSTLQGKDRGSEDHGDTGDRGSEDHGDTGVASGGGVRLLSEAYTTADSGDSNPSSMSAHVPQRECKDEAYVTMSSLFKTQ